MDKLNEIEPTIDFINLQNTKATYLFLDILQMNIPKKQNLNFIMSLVI